MSWICSLFSQMRTYVPTTKDQRSLRWYIRTTRGKFESLTTGAKWRHVRAEKGGGGAIDVAMHVRRLRFVDAVTFLIDTCSLF